MAIIGIGWVFPFSVRQVLLAWQGSQVGKKRKKVWRAASLCIFWTVWRERNRVAFDNEAFSAYRLKSFSFVIFGLGPTCLVGGQRQESIGFSNMDGV